MYLENFFKIIGNFNFKKVNIFFSILLIFFHALVYTKYEINIYNLLQYIIFHLFYILIPGYFFYNFFFQLDNDNYFKKFAFTFGFGIFFIIIEYFILQYFQKLHFITYVNPILCLIFLLFFFYKKQKINFKIPVLKIISSVNFFSILFLLFVFLFGSIFGSPPVSINEVASYSQDKLFVVGMLEGLLRDFPPPDMKVANVNLNYHGYFSFIYLAVVSQVTSIPPFDLYFYLSQYFKIIFFIMSLSYFSQFIFKIKKEDNAFIFIAIFFSCSSLFYNFFHNAGNFGNENLFSITVFPNGYMLAMTYTFLIVPEIIKSFKIRSFSVKNLLLFSLFLIMINGSKAPNAAFIVGAIDLFLIFLLFLKTRINLQFIAIVITTNILFFIFLFLFYMKAGSNVDVIFHIGQLFRGYDSSMAPYTASFYNFVSLFFIPFHQILFHPFSVFIFYFYIFSNLFIKKNKSSYLNFIKKYFLNFINFNKDKNYQELFIFSAIIISFVSYIFTFPFGTTSYFMMIGAYFFSVFSLQLLFKKKLNLNNKLKNFLFILILISLLSMFFGSLRHLSKGSLIFLNTFVNKKECENISHNNNTSITKFDKYYSLDNCPDWDRLTHHEYLGLIWIKENTPRNSIILSDRIYYDSSHTDGNARYFYYSAFSERMLYLEGYYYWVDKTIANNRKNLLNIFYNKETSTNHRINFSINNNIDYIIVSNFLNKELILKDTFFSTVYDNRDITIYKIKN